MNDKMISKKTKEGGGMMNAQKAEDVKNMAVKLNSIYSCCPEDYYYLKGWIHCLLQKEDRTCRHMDKPPKRTA